MDLRLTQERVSNRYNATMPAAQALSRKTLHLLRHAKSSWKEPGLDDHERPAAPSCLAISVRVPARPSRRSLIQPRALPMESVMTSPQMVIPLQLIDGA
jgi:hypothetical protein